LVSPSAEQDTAFSDGLLDLRHVEMGASGDGFEVIVFQLLCLKQRIVYAKESIVAFFRAGFESYLGGRLGAALAEL